MNRRAARLSAVAGVLVAFAAVSPRVRADAAEEAQVEFELGALRYKAGDWLGALAHFLASNRLAANRNVVYNIAHCYEQLQRYPDAFRAYTAALEGETDAQQKANLESAIARIAPQVAVLEVQSDPPGATVYIDREDLGARGLAPRQLGLDPGTYKVLVRKDGYEPAAPVEVKIVAGSTKTVLIKLAPIFGEVTVDGESTGAVVRVDRDDAPVAGTIPCTLSIIPGHHVLYLTRPGYQPVELPVDLAPKQKLEVRPKLIVVTGAVVVNADVRDALIEIDGKPVGFTPTVLQVPVGPHALSVSMSGFRPNARAIVVEANKETRVEVALTENAEVTAASRSTETVEEAPASVTVIPKSELRGMGYPTIADALVGVRGLYVTDDRSYQTLGVRGFSRVGDYGNKVLVMVDGQPTNDDYVESSYIGYDGRVDLDDVERIEVVRGPGSVLYGTSAFFGVVNLVTRDRSAPTHVEAGLSTAEYGVGRARVHATYHPIEDAGIWISASGAHSAGRDFYFSEYANNTSFPTSDGVARGVDGFNAGTISGRAFWKDLTVQWFYTARKKTMPTGEYGVLFNSPDNTLYDRRGFIEARFEPKLADDVQWLTRAHVNLYNYDGDLAYAAPPDDKGPEHDTFRGRWAGLEERVVLTPVKELKLTLGGEVQRNWEAHQVGYNTTSYIIDRDDPFWVGAGYLLADWAPSDRIKVSPGARLDYYHYDTLKNAALSLNPRLAVVTRPWTGGILKILAGKAFREPSVYELFYRSETQVAPNGILTPETIYSGEVEVTQRLSPTVSAIGAVYVNYVRNLIELAGGGTASAPNVYQNSSRPILAYGAEAEVRRDWRQGWMVSAQVSVQHTEYLNNGDGALREVPNSPWILGAVRGAVPILGRALALTSRASLIGPRWDHNEYAHFQANLSSPVQTDAPQGKTDAAVIWDLVLGGEAERAGVRYSLGIYNLMNWKYGGPVSREFQQTQIVQPGRTLFASSSITF